MIALPAACTTVAALLMDRPVVLPWVGHTHGKDSPVQAQSDGLDHTVIESLDLHSHNFRVKDTWSGDETPWVGNAGEPIHAHQLRDYPGVEIGSVADVPGLSAISLHISGKRFGTAPIRPGPESRHKATA